MSYFRQIAQGVMNPALDGAFGETVTVCPMIALANASPVPDKRRPTFEAVAIFTWKEDMIFNQSATTAHKGQLSRATDGPAIPVSTRKPVFSFAQPCAPAVRRGDHILRCVDDTRWEVISVMPDGVARVVVNVVQIGVQNREDI